MADPRGVNGVGRPPAFDLDLCVEQVLAGSKPWLARAITVVESTRADHQALAQQLLAALAPHAGRARRVGITGVPGAGKSTFIDALGVRLIGAGHRVAVLAVDPSSTRTGGSILGDKTRMVALSASPDAFVRPSPTAGTLGGVTKATREALLLVEAAGYDVVLVETVGVGQSEVTVADMVDTFVLLALSRAGDQLQGIKKGVLELADIVAVNKADGEHAVAATRTAHELAGALRLIAGASGHAATVLTCSARDGTGLDEVWAAVLAHTEALRVDGRLERRRAEQQLRWTWAMVHDRLLQELAEHPAVAAVAPDLERQVTAGQLTASAAATALLAAFHSSGRPEAHPA